jgi:hypothetical protein
MNASQRLRVRRQRCARRMFALRALAATTKVFPTFSWKVTVELGCAIQYAGAEASMRHARQCGHEVGIRSRSATSRALAPVFASS